MESGMTFEEKMAAPATDFEFIMNHVRAKTQTRESCPGREEVEAISNDPDLKLRCIHARAEGPGSVAWFFLVRCRPNERMHGRVLVRVLVPCSLILPGTMPLLFLDSPWDNATLVP